MVCIQCAGSHRSFGVHVCGHRISRTGGVVKGMLKPTSVCQNLGPQVQSEVFEAGYIETWFAPIFFGCLEFWLEVDRHVGGGGWAVEEILGGYLRPFHIQSRYAALMVWTTLVVSCKFLMGFQGQCRLNLRCYTQSKRLSDSGHIMFLHILIIRVQFNV